jgi:hypothetical protein
VRAAILAMGCSAAVLLATLCAEAASAPQGEAPRSQPASVAQPKKPRSVAETKVPASPKVAVAAPSGKSPDHPSKLLRRPPKEEPQSLVPKPHKSARHSKKSRKAKAEAVVRSRKDLMYHSILEGPSRYEPRRDHQTTGPPDPQTSELTYEHFQELDRNGDGSIDPVERAFGRLDMDHDLSKRQR